MTVYRICNPQFSEDLSGTGAKIFGGRWNSKGIAMLYTSEHISLAVLEMLVHNRFTDFTIDLNLLHIAIPDSITETEVNNNKLKTAWINDFEYTRFMGDQFLKAGTHAILKVPSAVIQEEHNFIINPLHADFKKIKIIQTIAFRTDKRLFSIK